MDSLICKYCRQISSVLRTTEYVRCHGCQRILSIGSTEEMSPGEEKIIGTKAKGIRHSLRKKFSGNNSLEKPIRPLVPIVISEPPPRGKRAFLCGVTYNKQKFKLRGTTQDLKNMRDLLVEQFSFLDDSILILAEEEPYKLPTRKNIEDAFGWLTRDLQSGDSLVFYFSGHGLRHLDTNGDEVDGFNESICPVDFQTQGMILDDDINRVIVRPLKQGVVLHAIIDCCHSGTVVDLPHVYNRDTGKWDENQPPSGAYKGTSGGRAVCFSACEDHQLAADTSALSPGRTMYGAMTYAFIRAIKEAAGNNQKVTYRGILDSMHDALEESDDRAGCLGAGIRRAFHRKIIQDPLLSASDKFDVNTEFKL